jgi:hypothetical protein
MVDAGMSGSNHDGFASAEDFKRLASERRAAGAVPLVLPSGLRVLAYRPSPEWWLRRTGRLPTGAAARTMGEMGKTNGAAQLSTDEIIDFARWTIDLLEEVILQPVIRPNPQPGEVDPAWVSNEDLSFIIRFAGGEIDASGGGLDRFSRRSPAGAGVGVGGEDVERPA